MGGMAAVIPSRTDEEANRRRSRPCAPTRSARPATASTAPGWPTPTRCPWRRRRSTRCSATGPTRSTASATTWRSAAADLLAIAGDPRRGHRGGPALNVNVGIQYISSWLRGNGAAGDLRADGGRRHGRDLPRPGLAVGPPRRELDDGRTITPELVRELEAEELERIRAEIGDDEWFEREGRPDLSRELFERVALCGRVRRVPDAAGVRAAGGLGARSGGCCSPRANCAGCGARVHSCRSPVT